MLKGKVNSTDFLQGMAHQRISIVIPVLNEALYIGRLLSHLLSCSDESVCDIVVVDGGSTDETAQIVAQFPEVVWLSMSDDALPVCRATQMNLGADSSIGEILWFVHADTLPPASFCTDIRSAVAKGKNLGGYAFDFESNRLLLRLNSWFTRFNWSFTRGGDQTLFITRDLWQQLKGYKAHFIVMEEYDLIDRAAALGCRYHRLRGAVRVSARKYDENSYMQVQRANLAVFRMYRAGVDPTEIRNYYYRHLNHPKDNHKGKD